MGLEFTNREIKTYIKKGTFAGSPKAPALQRDSDMYELGLAEISISAGATTITQGDITDLRLDNNSCGVVHGVVDQVDTTTIFNQYKTWLEDRQAEYGNEFNDWFAKNTANWIKEFNDWFITVRGLLSEDIAGSLANGIYDLQTRDGILNGETRQTDYINLVLGGN